MTDFLSLSDFFFLFRLVTVIGGSATMTTLKIADVDRLVTISRVMLPDDANPGGNVHGGTILKMIEEAGWIAATKHCNGLVPTRGGLFKKKPLVAALVRVEHMDFLQTDAHWGGCQGESEITVTVKLENFVHGLIFINFVNCAKLRKLVFT